MEEFLNPTFKEFNRLYKEETEIYREISLRLGSCNSAISILYDLCSLGEGCTQKDICDSSFLTKQLSIPLFASWKHLDIFTSKKEKAAICTSISQTAVMPSSKKRFYQ